MKSLTNKKISKLFASRVVELRRKHAMTQTELAKKLDVDTSSVANWEIAIRLPRYDTLIKIAKEFNVSVDWLLGITSSPLSNDAVTALFSLSPRVINVIQTDRSNAQPILEFAVDCIESGIPMEELRELFNNIFTIKNKMGDK